MARGRRHVPPATNEGTWFQHRGTQSAGNSQRIDSTSTGLMLSAPFRSNSAHHPQPPPQPFNTKSDRNYRQSNRFSEHDNRNSFQTHGVYFGDGQDTRQLGRNLIDPLQRLHKSDKHYLKHNGRQPIDFEYNTNYQRSYKGEDTEKPPVHRRFRKSLPELKPTGRVPLDTTTTDWQPTSAPEHRTNTQVLAVSQEPFLQHNPWKYGYNPKKSVYPQYNRRSDPVIDNTLNRYGAAFNSSGSFNTSGFSQLETTGCS